PATCCGTGLSHIHALPACLGRSLVGEQHQVHQLSVPVQHAAPRSADPHCFALAPAVCISVHPHLASSPAPKMPLPASLGWVRCSITFPVPVSPYLPLPATLHRLCSGWRGWDFATL